MTRKDFVMIAEVIANAYYLNESQRLTLARSFADEISFTHPRFDHARFVKACLMTIEKKIEHRKAITAQLSEEVTA